MERKIHDLVQGSDEWLQFRLEHNGASEAAAMLGLSKKTNRPDLMAMKHSGDAKEFSDWVQKNILDYGHEVEAKARPIVEEKIGDELYPATMSYGKLSASCDGLTMMGDKAFEHKQWARELAESVMKGVVPEEHMPQCQQVLFVTGADLLLFVVSDGTAQNMVMAEVLPDKAWQERLVTGWAQFDEDLAVYVPQEVIPAAVAAPIRDLPALNIQITGDVVASNLAQWKDVVTERIAEINTDLQSDQDFADAAKMVTFLKEGEERVDLVKSQAQSQAATIDEVFRAMDEIRETMRVKRLELNNLVEARKKSIRIEIQQEGEKALAEHIAALNARLGKPYMPSIPADFAGAMRAKKNIASLRAGVDHELTRCRIESSAIADRIDLNLKTLRELAKDHTALFPDTPQIVLKANDDLVSLIKTRITEHKAAEEQKLEAERERIRQEEREKLERAAREEERLRVEAERQRVEAEEKQRATTETATPPATPLATAPTPTGAGPAVAAATIIHAAPDTGRMMNLGEICARLDFTVTAALLERIGFQAMQDIVHARSKFYRESDFPAICQALINHVADVANERKAA